MVVLAGGGKGRTWSRPSAIAEKKPKPYGQTIRLEPLAAQEKVTLRRFTAEALSEWHGQRPGNILRW